METTSELLELEDLVRELEREARERLAGRRRRGCRTRFEIPEERRAWWRWRLARNIEPIPIAGCWIWTGALERSGHGAIKFDGRKTTAARVVWAAFVGPVAGDVDVHALCGLAECVAPAHHALLSRSSLGRRLFALTKRSRVPWLDVHAAMGGGRRMRLQATATAADRARWKQAARRRERTLGEWIAETLNRQAKFDLAGDTLPELHEGDQADG